MTTYAEILAFVKSVGRIVDTSFDTVIGNLINQSYRKYCRRLQSLSAPGMRGTATFAIVDGQQDYDLESDFDALIDNSVRYYTDGETDYRLLQVVSGPDAELWEAMDEAYSPQACRVVAGSTGTQRKMRLLPAFSETGKTVAYSYWKRPATLSSGSTLELPELSDAVAWDTLAALVDFTRDANAGSQQVNYLGRAKAAYQEALGTLNP